MPNLYVTIVFLPSEERQKKKKQQKKKHSSEGKTSLQRSKTFVSLFFRKDRKEKSGSKSSSADRGEEAALECLSFLSRTNSPLFENQFGFQKQNKHVHALSPSKGTLRHQLMLHS